MHPAVFAEKWWKLAPGITEQAGAQTHWSDLCAVLDRPKPTEHFQSADYAFERQVRKVGTGTAGRADVFMRDRFIVEYKRAGGELGQAMQQAFLYARELGNPPLIVASDFLRMRIETNFTATPPRNIHLTLDDISTNRQIDERHTTHDVLRALFDDPEELHPRHIRERITRVATAQIGAITQALKHRGAPARQAAHFMMRLVFAMFAEDIGMLPQGLMGRVLKRAQLAPHMSQSTFQELFRAMQHGGPFWDMDLRHFNGGLFDDQLALEITAQEAARLQEAALLDWSNVEPVIFGTLFENSLENATRSRLGAHFTDVRDILRVTDVVIMDPLRREWQTVKTQAEELAQRKATRLAAGEVLKSFQERLARTFVLDPACGSGNFLVVALGQLLDLEHEVRELAHDLGAGRLSMPPLVHPKQMHGLEIEPAAYELASISTWISYFQWHAARDKSSIQREPILQKLSSIQNRDALLNEDGTEAVWPEAEFIVGNPPFMGDKVMRTRLGSDYTENLREVYGDRLPGQSDLVCYWPEKARAAIEAGTTCRAGFVTTNSIRGGKNRVVLERIKVSGDLFMAWPDEPWEQDGAAVRVSLFGFDGGSEELRMLNDEHVAVINADLTAGSDVTAAVPLAENAGLSFIGTQKGGAFDISEEVALAWLDLPNPTGVSNREVVKPWVNGMDIARRPSRRWIVDFNQMGESAASAYLLPFSYIQRAVKPEREGSRDRLSKVHWWLHQRSRPDMRVGLAGLSRYLVTPRVAKHRLWVYVPANTVPDSRLVVIAREDEAMLGVLSSSIHEWWSLAQGGWHGVGNDPQYNAVSCFETFPFPNPTDEQRAEIEESVQYIVQLRECLLALSEKATLTGLYNDVARLRQTLDATHPTAALAIAHDRLDAAVAAAYGWEGLPSKDEVLARLLALNLERAEDRCDRLSCTCLL